MMRVSMVLRARSISRGVGPLGPERVELLVDRLLEFLRRVSRARRRLDPELRAEHQRLLIDVHVLRDLLFVDQLLVEAARTAAAQNRRRDLGVGIARLEDRRRQPRHVDTRQLRSGQARPPALGGDRRRVRRDRRHGGTALQRAEVLLDERLACAGIDVADDREARVVRRVVPLEELLAHRRAAPPGCRRAIR